MSHLTERQEGHVRVFTLDRPAVLNALTMEDMRALGARLEPAGTSPDVHAVVVTGAGTAFSAGGNTRLLQRLPGMPADAVRDVVTPRTELASARSGSVSAACPRSGACSCSRASWAWAAPPR